MKRKSRYNLEVEALEAREVPSVSPMVDNVGVVRDGHTWFLDSAGDGLYAEQIRGFGLPGDQFLAADWNGDGKDDLIAIRPTADGRQMWYVDLNGDDRPDIIQPYGLRGDMAIAGDWNGDGKDDPGVA